MKLFKVLILVAFLLVASCFVTCAKDNIKLFVNGKEIVSDVSPEVINSRTLVPVRSVFEELGADVTWIASRKHELFLILESPELM